MGGYLCATAVCYNCTTAVCYNCTQMTIFSAMVNKNVNVKLSVPRLKATYRSNFEQFCSVNYPFKATIQKINWGWPKWNKLLRIQNVRCSQNRDQVEVHIVCSLVCVQTKTFLILIAKLSLPNSYMLFTVLHRYFAPILGFKISIWFSHGNNVCFRFLFLLCSARLLCDIRSDVCCLTFSVL